MLLPYTSSLPNFCTFLFRSIVDNWMGLFLEYSLIITCKKKTANKKFFNQIRGVDTPESWSNYRTFGCVFHLFSPHLHQNEAKLAKSLFWPMNRLRSTHSLVEIYKKPTFFFRSNKRIFWWTLFSLWGWLTVLTCVTILCHQYCSTTATSGQKSFTTQLCPR